ncbi:riboflavin synthase subunit alpha [Fusobacterium canifelinum]|uniref:Riboflavin synthase subunit alpha n=1 Tax=Fusobacterium canifelinum TaxID=285729 RepID=A0A3P1UQL9_9FUSO|nr:riboflavin synthase subunit alpha [Fusobacterium canifelinum]
MVDFRKKSNRVSRANAGVFEVNLLTSLPDLQRTLDFLSLRNLLSNELFLSFIFCILQLFF